MSPEDDQKQPVAGEANCSQPTCSAPSQFVARWRFPSGGTMVACGDWNEAVKAAQMIIEMGATKVEIETVTYTATT